MWDFATFALLVATILPTAEPEPDLELVVLEGTISVGSCSLMPPMPICALRADPDGHEYALVDIDGNGVYDLTEVARCANEYVVGCRGSVRVRGYMTQFDCGGFEGRVMDAIWIPEIIPLDDGPPCGDVTGNRVIDLSDPVAILNHLFSSTGLRLCPGVSDVNGDGKLDISDAIFLLSYLFLGGPAPRCS